MRRALANISMAGLLLFFRDPKLEHRFLRFNNVRHKETDFCMLLTLTPALLAWLSKWSLAESKLSLFAITMTILSTIGMALLCLAHPLYYTKHRETLCVVLQVIYRVCQHIVDRYAITRHASYSPLIALLDSSSFSQVFLLAVAMRVRFSTHIWTQAGLLFVTASHNDAICSAAWPQVPGLRCFTGMLLFELVSIFAATSTVIWVAEKKQRAAFALQKLLTTESEEVLQPVDPREWLHAQLNRPDLDVIQLCGYLGQNAVQLVVGTLLEREGLIQALGLDCARLDNFLHEVGAGYPASNPYHSQAHVVAVVHLTHLMLTRFGLRAHIRHSQAPQSAHLTCLAAYLAAAVHDYQHVGLTNAFLVRTLDPKALAYNDASPNEHHHLAAAFALLLRPEYNFLTGRPAADFAAVRKLVISVVLGTDMQQYAGALRETRAAFELAGELSVESALQLAMKCADLGHTAASLQQHKAWVFLLEEEFFRQGDLERRLGLSVSPGMDRLSRGVSRDQVGFFQNVVLPQLETYVRAFPLAAPLLNSATANMHYWQQQQQQERLQQQ